MFGDGTDDDIFPLVHNIANSIGEISEFFACMHRMGNRQASSPKGGSGFFEPNAIKVEYKRALARMPPGKIPRIRQIFSELTRQSSSTGRVDRASFLRYFPLPGMMGERLFSVFDRDSSGSIDYTEFFIGLATIYHGTMEDKKRFLFDMYDLDGNGEITRAELFTMLSYIPAAFQILEEPHVHAKPEMEEKIKKIVDSVFEDKKNSETLSFDEFQIAISRNSAVSEIINIFYDEGLPENNSEDEIEILFKKNACKCPFCETVIQFAHCMHCGAALPARPAVVAADIGPVSCIECGFRFPEPHHCFSCGHPLKSTLDQRESDSEDSSESSEPESLEDHPSSYEESFDDHKIVSGYLSKTGRTTLVRRTRFFLLKDCFLYYYSNANSLEKPKGVIFLPGVLVSPTDTGFVLKSGRKRRIFFCSNSHDRQRWIAALLDASKTRDIHDYYKLELVPANCIGKGKFSSVFTAENKETGEIVAVKILISDQDMEFVRTELAIVKLVSHPNVVRTIDVFESVDTIYIVMEKIAGGDLLHRLFREVSLSEFDAQRILVSLLNAIQYIHEKGIIHRDIKPENILISAEGIVKLTDFGLSALTTVRLDTPLGTVGYAAPEVLLSLPYDKSVDMWSLGAVTYVMLAGEMPFKGRSDKEIAASVLKAKFSFTRNKIWTNISDSAKDFISNLLVKNSSARMTATEALSHAWLEGFSRSEPSARIY